MSYPGQGATRDRLAAAPVANLWQRTGYLLVWGAPSTGGATAGILRYGQQAVSPIAGASDAEAALVRGPFVLTDFVVRNRVTGQTVDMDYMVAIDGVTALSVSIAAGVIEQSTSGAVVAAAGLHLVRVEFTAAGVDATLSGPASSVRIVELN